MTEQSIYLDIDGPIAAIVLNRPDKANALSREMWEAIPGLVRAAEASPAVRVLLIRSSERGAFSAGADLAEFKANAGDVEKSVATQTAFRAACAAVRASRLPSVAQVEGACVGGGCGLAIACDFRAASPKARFGITPAKLGLVYPLSEVKALVDLVGSSWAKGLLFTGRIITAEEACMIGLVNKIHPDDLLADEVVSFCKEIASTSPYAARGHKRMLELILAGATTDTAETVNLFRDAFAGPDYQEGVAAFLEKRSPHF